MPNLNIDRRMNLDYGIDGIVHARGSQAETQGLPERRNLTPTDDPVRTQLTQLLEKSNIGHVLEEALRPEIGNRDLLMPARFRAVLQQVQKDLAALADQSGNDSRILSRAVRVLKNEAELRDLVAMYRSVLYQG